MSMPIKAFIINPVLSTPKAPQGWKGTPMDSNGQFQNLHHPFIPSWRDVLRWKLLQTNPFKQEKKKELWNPKIVKDESWITGKADIIVWLGHCTFFIRINGIQILTDPVYDRIYPLKRRSEFPVNPAHLKGLDYVLLSHDHRDHLDRSSLRLLTKHNQDTKYLTGLKMKKLIHRFTGSEKIEEAGWYQQYNTRDEIQITFIPMRHWSRRGLNDTNKSLWGGFVIEAGGKRILFGGDSAYDVHYKDIGDLFGPFNYALLGIGAYEPVWFMKTNHQSPAEALQASENLRADYLVPMHYGTFDLSDEPMGKPLEVLRAEAEKRQLSHKLKVIDLGEPLLL